MHGFSRLYSLPVLGEKSVCAMSGYCSAAVALKLQNFANCLQSCTQVQFICADWFSVKLCSCVILSLSLKT